jgi:hypothetical protein
MLTFILQVVVTLLTLVVIGISLKGFRLHYTTIPNRTYKMPVVAVEALCVIGIILEVFSTVCVWYWLIGII